MSIVETEQVLVIPTEHFRQLGYFQGFSTQAVDYLDKLLSPNVTSYRPRGEMETDPSFKQLIPYVIFRYIDPQGIAQVFHYTRGSGQGEERLHAKMSIGIGGHISLDDSYRAESCPYEEGMRRELEEEVVIRTDYDSQRVGLINDDATDVGRVHLGVVHIFDVVSPRVEPREADIQSATFCPVDELRAELHRMESWSSICFEALFPASD